MYLTVNSSSWNLACVEKKGVYWQTSPCFMEIALLVLCFRSVVAKLTGQNLYNMSWNLTAFSPERMDWAPRKDYCLGIYIINLKKKIYIYINFQNGALAVEICNFSYNYPHRNTIICAIFESLLKMLLTKAMCQGLELFSDQLDQEADARAFREIMFFNLFLCSRWHKICRKCSHRCFPFRQLV